MSILLALGTYLLAGWQLLLGLPALLLHLLGFLTSLPGWILGGTPLAGMLPTSWTSGGAMGVVPPGSVSREHLSLLQQITVRYPRTQCLLRAVALAALGGCGRFAFAPYEMWWLLPLLLLVLFLVLHTAPRGWVAFRWCFYFSWGYFLSMVSWVQVSLYLFGGMPWVPSWIATALLAAILSPSPAIAAGIACRLARSAPLDISSDSKGAATPAISPHRFFLLLLPAGWLLGEWLRGCWLFTGFPWAAVGYSQIPDGPLAGYAPIVGIYGVGGLLIGWTGALAWLLHFAWRHWRKGGANPVSNDASAAAPATTASAGESRCLRPSYRSVYGVLLLLCVLPGGGLVLHRVTWVEAAGAPWRVSLVQPAIAQENKWELSARLGSLQQFHQQIEQAPGQLVVLPETALPYYLHELPRDYLTVLRSLALRRGIDVITGVPLLVPEALAAQPQRERTYLAEPLLHLPAQAFTRQREAVSLFNAAILLSQPELPYVAKRHLVPFGEYIPLRPLTNWIYRNWLHIPLTDFVPPAREASPVLTVQGHRLAVNICYENLFGEEMIVGARDADVLLNLSNLAWYVGSDAIAQSGQIAQARALELGRPFILSTNTGPTAGIDARGYFLDRLPEDQPGVLTVTVQGTQGSTPYLLWGNLPTVLLGALLLGAGGRRTRRNRAPSPIVPTAPAASTTTDA